MRRIWKFTFAPNSLRDAVLELWVPMPDGAIPRHVGVDADGIPCIWAEVDPAKDTVPRKFYSIGTGHGVVPDDARFFGTMITPEGYVWHIYEPVDA